MSVARLLSSFVACCALLLATAALAAPPLLLGAQGRLVAQGGGPVADGKYGLVVSLYPASDAKDSLWSEALVGVGVQGGLFALQLGANAKNPLDPTLFVKSAEVWLGVAVDGEPELARVRLVSVPFALSAQEAGHAAKADTLTAPLDPALLAPASISQDKLGFAFAGSDSKGGAAKQALDLACSGCVEAGEVGVGAVGTGSLADGAVTSVKIAKGAVTKDHLAFSYAGSESAGGAAYFAEIANGLKCTGCVVPDSLADGAVTTAKIADGAVTKAKLAADAIAGDAFSVFRFPVAETHPFSCDDAHFGYAYANKKQKTLFICNGQDMFPLLIDTVGTAKNPGVTCADILAKQPASKDGAYFIDPDGVAGVAAFEVYCDMTTDGGGWTLVGKTAGLAHDADGGVLDGHDTLRWKDRKYLGDVTNLAAASALGPAYESVPFTDFLLRGLNDGTKKLAWRIAGKQPSLFAVFTSGQTIKTTNVLVGSFKTLDWRPGCGTGNGPDATGPQFYGFNVNADSDSQATLFNGYSKGWCAALAGWGRDNGAGDYTGGGLGAACWSGHGHQMGRHYWGYGDGCDAAGWSNQSNLNAFYGHAFFVR